MKLKRKYKTKNSISKAKTNPLKNAKATLAKHIPDGPARDKVPYSTEQGRGYEDYEVSDDLDSSDYPPPSKNPLYRKFWSEGIESLTGRKNFKDIHLALFDTYCRLRTELHTLDSFIHAHGYTFLNRTAMGERRQTYPEVVHRGRVIAQIATYSKMLDLLPSKDMAGKRQNKKLKEDDDWT